MMFLAILLGAALALMALERLFPDQELPRVEGWWGRVVVINAFQLAAVLLSSLTFERYLQNARLLTLGATWPPFWGGLLCYLFLTFVYYGWHRARHEINFLWLSLHQVHHSASRIEVVTSFYKHPLEILVNGLIISGISYTLFGLDTVGAGWVGLFTGLAELFYHMNIRTPRWLGFILQRPESHRLHHRRGRHYGNFADLPVWDMLFGTFENPETYRGPCGFKPERERRLLAMLLFRNVNGPRRRDAA